MSARGPQARPRAHPYILDSAFLHLCQDCRHDTFLHRAVTFKQIKLIIPAWSGFEGREKIFLTVMWFFLFKIFLVEISPLEAKTYNCLTFHNLYQEGCLCKTITFKRIKLKIPPWSGFVGLEKLFPLVMCFFFYTNYFRLRYYNCKQ